MAHSRRFGRSAHGASTARRKTSWGSGPSGVISRTATGSNLFAVGAQATVAGLTLVRTRGNLLVFLSSIATALDGFSGAIGMAIVSENAFGVGVTAIPTPVTDLAWDGWLYHRFFSVKGVTATEADGANAVSAVERIQIDSKAMRKFKETDLLVAVIEGTEVGGVTFNATLETRTLVKLP